MSRYRIGVNAGSLDKRLYKQFGGVTPEALVESARIELAYFSRGRVRGREDLGQGIERAADDRRLPARVRDLRPSRCISGSPKRDLRLQGCSREPPGIATLLAEGIGDTIRYSLTADPVEEARAGRQLLEALGLRERKGLDLIACPSCGRAEIDVIGVAKAVQEALEDRNLPLQVAVMGCVVNGPGEAREADLGIAAGRHKGHLFIKGEIVRVVPEAGHGRGPRRRGRASRRRGIEARLAAADEGAAAEAEADRAALLESRGDANHDAERVELVRRAAVGRPDRPGMRVANRARPDGARSVRARPTTATASASSWPCGSPPSGETMHRTVTPSAASFCSPPSRSSAIGQAGETGRGGIDRIADARRRRRAAVLQERLCPLEHRRVAPPRVRLPPGPEICYGDLGRAHRSRASRP